MGRLNAMVGQAGVKDEVDSLVNAAVIDALNVERGQDRSTGTMHMIFEGPAGTGKTTVAQEIGNLYYALGLVPTPNYKKVGRADLVATHVGNTAPKVRDVFYGNAEKGIKPGIGGVIFIDEAYSLYQGENDAYGAEAIQELIQLVEQHRDDTVVILAGYSKGNETMDRLMSANAGFASRFPRTIYFKDFDEGQRMQIAENAISEMGYTFGGPKAASRATSALQAGVRLTGDGNARDVRNLVEAIVREQKNRLGARRRVEGYTPSERELSLLTAEDIAAGSNRYATGRR